MSDSSQPAVNPALVARVKGILLQPKAEWQIIDGEFATSKSLYSGYALILAAIGPIATLFASVVFKHNGIVGAVILAALSYVLSLAAIYVFGVIINALASSFGGTPNAIQAQKLAVYSYTAAWVAGVAYLIPGLGEVVSFVGGIYTLVLLFFGLPVLMKVPEDKKVVYYVVTLLAGFALIAIASLVVAAIAATFAFATIGAAAFALS